MKLFVCYGTFKHSPRPGGLHPCGTAHRALTDAGYEPEVVRTFGAGMLGPLFNLTPGRREVKRLTGSYMVPVLVTDDGTVISESSDIAAWARSHPAPAPAAAA